MHEFSDPNYLAGSSSSPLQSVPGAAQLDMNVSCLFMHEVNLSTFFIISNFIFFFF
jgi:hypothetical protein